MIYVNPDNKTSWGTQGVDAWYTGPSLNHYHCMKVFVPKTRNYVVSGSFDHFSQKGLLPDLVPSHHTIAVTDDLVETIQQIKKQNWDLLKKLGGALQQLSTEQTAQPQRVGTEATSEGGKATTEKVGRNRGWAPGHPRSP